MTIGARGCCSRQRSIYHLPQLQGFTEVRVIACPDAVTVLSMRLPTSVPRKVKELALREEISPIQFIASAVAENMSACRRANFETFLAFIPKVPVDQVDC